MEPTESEEKTANQAERPTHVMPGMVTKVAAIFRRRRGVNPTPRKIAQDMNRQGSGTIPPEVVVTSLFAAAFDEIEELRAMVSRKPPASESMRPESPRMQIVSRRSA